MNKKNPLNVAIVTVNDTIYAPLYVSRIYSGLAEGSGIRVKVVYARDATSGMGMWKQVKRRLDLYGICQFLLFILLFFRTKFQAFLEPLIGFKRPYSLNRLCSQKGIEFQPVSDVNSESFIRSLHDLGIDVLISIADSQLYKKRTRETVAYPLNIHSSLLPKYAGLMGLFWAVVHGETEVGVSLFVMGKKFDDGDILGQVAFELKDLDSLHQLYHLAVLKGSGLVVEVLKAIAANRVKRVPQDPASRSYFSWPRKGDRDRFFELGYKFFRVRDIWA